MDSDCDLRDNPPFQEYIPSWCLQELDPDAYYQVVNGGRGLRKVSKDRVNDTLRVIDSEAEKNRLPL